MEYRPRRRRKRENTLIQIFTTARIGLLIIASLMILEEFGVEIAPILAAGIVSLAFGFGGQYPSEILYRVFLLFSKINIVGDIVSFDNAGGTVQEISLRKRLYVI
jgi:small conductance mechanosensitive channel